MNSKKYLSALLLVLSITSSNALRAEQHTSSRYSLGNTVDNALHLPGRVLDDAADVVTEPINDTFDEEEVIVEEEPLEDEYELDDIEDGEIQNTHNYGYNNYGYTDEDNIDSDYNAELE
jgi:hypothetical protein